MLLGGNVVLDNVITDNQTKFKLGEDATVTRNAGFTLGGLKFDNNTFTLGSATTDLTLEIGSSDNSSGSNTGSSGGQTNTGSPPGTFATKLADLTVISADAVDITTGTTITSTGGKFSFAKGIKMQGAAISLQDTTLSVGSSLTKTGGTLALNQLSLIHI